MSDTEQVAPARYWRKMKVYYRVREEGATEDYGGIVFTLNGIAGHIEMLESTLCPEAREKGIEVRLVIAPCKPRKSV